MESMYPTIKHIHLILVTISIALFNIRVWLLATRPNLKLATLWKIVPHINDTILLFSGMMMMAIAKWQPFGIHKWLGVKFILLVAYILFGIMCLRSRPRSGKFWIMYALALISVTSIICLARLKPF